MVKSEYRYIKDLGEGSFGKVVLVKRDDVFLARKEMSDSFDLLIGIKEMNIAKLASYLSPYVVKMIHHDLYLTSPNTYRIDQYLEYCKDGCLDELITEESNSPIGKLTLGDVSNRIQNIKNLIYTLTALHENGIFHMDIKSENILCNGSKYLLCDFSNSIVKTPWKINRPPSKSQYQSLIYRSPDIASMRTDWENAEKSDVWAVGILIMEILGLANKITDFENKTDKSGCNIKNIVSKFKVRESSTKNIRCKIFSTIFPNDISGWDLSECSSDAYGYIWCIMFASLVRDLNFESLYLESMDFFTKRNCIMTEDDKRDLHAILTKILPKMLDIHPSRRYCMKEVCNALDISPPSKRLPDTVSQSIQDDLWSETIVHLKREFKKINLIYGQKTCEIQDVILDYSISLAELYISKISIPTENETKRSMYVKIYTASVLIGCEMFDSMIEFEDDDILIKDVVSVSDAAPYVIDICNLLGWDILLIPTK